MLIIYDVGIIEIMESIDELDSCLWNTFYSYQKFYGKWWK
jgi:hypothetical protein